MNNIMKITIPTNITLEKAKEYVCSRLDGLNTDAHDSVRLSKVSNIDELIEEINNNSNINTRYYVEWEFYMIRINITKNTNSKDLMNEILDHLSKGVEICPVTISDDNVKEIKAVNEALHKELTMVFVGNLKKNLDDGAWGYITEYNNTFYRPVNVRDVINTTERVFNKWANDYMANITMSDVFNFVFLEKFNDYDIDLDKIRAEHNITGDVYFEDNNGHYFLLDEYANLSNGAVEVDHLEIVRKVPYEPDISAIFEDDFNMLDIDDVSIDGDILELEDMINDWFKKRNVYYMEVLEDPIDLNEYLK